MEEQIRSFWQQSPCGEKLVGNLQNEDLETYEEFFERYDKYRYEKEPHILSNLAQINFRGKKVLEIGLGQGADSEQIIKRGGIFSGIDLTEESVKRTKIRFLLKDLPFENIKQASALKIPFADNSFDIVYSHGVLHHIPDIKTAVKEIERIIKPNGELIVMLYAKISLNYLFSILILKRLGLLLLYSLKIKIGGNYGKHLKKAKETGIWKYLSMKNFIHANTDGHLNPYTKVYDVSTVKNDFVDFQIMKFHKHFLYGLPLKINCLPLERLLGWHLWVHLKSKNK